MADLTGSSPRPKVFYGWWVVLAIFGLNILWGGALFQGFTVFFNPLKSALGLSALAVTVAIQMRALFAMVSAPLVGSAYDRFGPRPLFVASALVTASGIVALSFVTSVTTFFLTMFLVSLGSVVWQGGIAPAAVAAWFRRHRGKALGLAQAGISLGGILIPLMVLIEETWGWRWLARAVAMLLIVVFIPIAMTLRHRPEQYGLQPDGAAGQSGSVPQSQLLPSAQRQAAQTDAELTLRQTLRLRAFWFLIAGECLAGIGGQAVTVFFIPHLQAEGISLRVAGLAFTAVAFMGILGQPLFGYMADRWSKRLVLSISGVLGGCSIVLFAFVNSPWQLVPFAILYGLSARTAFSIAANLIAEYYGRRHYGKIQGVLVSTTNGLNTVATFLVAGMFDLTGSYATSLLVVGGLSLATPLAMLGATRPQPRSVPTPKPAQMLGR
jgi:MFS family permease